MDDATAAGMGHIEYYSEHRNGEVRTGFISAAFALLLWLGQAKFNYCKFLLDV